MYWLGLAIVLSSLPGYTFASIPAGWAAMSMFLPVTLWREAKLTSLHILFLCFLGWVALSCAWSPDWRDGAFRVWQFTLLYLAFRLGSSLEDPIRFINGLVTGCVVSSGVACFQALGYHPFLELAYATGGDQAPGIFYNHSIAGQTLALAAIAALSYALWWQALALLPGIYLSGSRGGWVVLAVGFVFLFWRSNKALFWAYFILVAAVLLSTHSAEVERMLIWTGSARLLTPFGHGAGSFTHLYLALGDTIRHPVDTHNDLLQLLFEFGIGASYLLIIFGACLSQRHFDEWPTLASFTLLGAVSFPLYTPTAACLAALCAGRLAVNWNWSWPDLPIRRYAFHQRHPASAPGVCPAGGEAVPVLTRTP